MNTLDHDAQRLHVRRLSRMLNLLASDATADAYQSPDVELPNLADKLTAALATLLGVDAGYVEYAARPS